MSHNLLFIILRSLVEIVTPRVQDSLNPGLLTMLHLSRYIFYILLFGRNRLALQRSAVFTYDLGLLGTLGFYSHCYINT